MSKSKAKKAPVKVKAKTKAALATKPPPRPTTASLDLSALDFGSDETRVAAGGGKPLLVPFEQVYEDPNNPRITFISEKVEALAVDIAANGMLQPIVTWDKDDRGYRIRYGAQRRRAAEIAAKKTGIRTVPIIISDVSLDDFAQVAENRFRDDLPALDFAIFAKRKQEEGLSVGEIGRRSNYDKATVLHHIALLNHPAPIRALFDNGSVTSVKNLYELNQLYKIDSQAVVAFIAQTEEITRVAIRALAERLNGKPSVGESAPQPGSGGRSTGVGTAQQTGSRKAVVGQGKTEEIGGRSTEGRGEEGGGRSTEGEGGEGGGRSTDSDVDSILSPTLTAELAGRTVTIQLYRRPPADGQVYVSGIQGEEGEQLVNTAELTNWKLTEGEQ